MSLPKFNKIYFSGLINLVFFPLLCICYFVGNNTFHKYRVMDVAIAPRDTINKWISRPGKKANIETFRKYEILTLTGDIKHDNKVLANLKILLNQLNIKNDTDNGIKINLTNSAKYGEFVAALDILFQNKDPNFGFDPIGNEIFIMHFPPRPKSVEIQRGDLHNDIAFTDNIGPPFISTSDKIKADLMIAYKVAIEFWPSWIAFSGMIGFVIFKRRRYLNLENFHLSGG